LVGHQVVPSYYVENSARQFHYPESVFETFVGCAWVNQVLHSQLVNVSQSLDRTGVKHRPLSGIERDEDMNRVTDFVEYFGGH
jgi:hypothetical protein